VHARIAPLLSAHLCAGSVDPGQILDLQLLVIGAGEEAISSQDGILGAQLRQPLHEAGQALTLRCRLPIEPADLIVLTVGIVVPALGAAKLISRQKHGSALGEEQRPEEIALLTLAQCVDRRILRRALRAAVPGAVVAAAVAVPLAIRLIVLLVVTHEIVQGEAIVGGHEIYARERPATPVIERLARCAQTLRHGARARRTFPEIPADIAIAVVPFPPPRWKAADLVAAGAAVPGLRDQLHRAQYRV